MLKKTLVFVIISFCFSSAYAKESGQHYMERLFKQATAGRNDENPFTKLMLNCFWQSSPKGLSAGRGASAALVIHANCPVKQKFYTYCMMDGKSRDLCSFDIYEGARFAALRRDMAKD